VLDSRVWRMPRQSEIKKPDEQNRVYRLRLAVQKKGGCRSPKAFQKASSVTINSIVSDNATRL
jgi:hypothetical protein